MPTYLKLNFMKKIFYSVIVFFSISTVLAAQTNTFPASGYAGIGTVSPATKLHLYFNSTTLSKDNFITIDNRGSNTSYATQHILGGILFSGYRDVRNPANVAGIWAIRNPSAANGGNFSSQGDLLFGTTDNPLNITTDAALPSERMRITFDGKIGIGTNAPQTQLDVNGTFRLGIGGSSVGNAYAIGLTRTGSVQLYGNATSGLLFGGDGTAVNMTILPTTGNVLIGKTTQTNSTYMLDVNGIIRSNQVVVNTTGADYVFDPLYSLSPLEKVEDFVKTYHHLPEIASAEEMQKNGVSLGDNQTLLLRKIEELTLYLIDQNKKQQTQQELIDQQAKLLNEQQTVLKDLQAELNKLKNRQ